MRNWLLIGICACATSRQRQSDLRQLKEQQADAVELRSQSDRTTAFDDLGGRHRLLSVSLSEWCFESSFQSSNGGAGVRFFLIDVDAEGVTHMQPQTSKSLIAAMSTDNKSGSAAIGLVQPSYDEKGTPRYGDGALGSLIPIDSQPTVDADAELGLDTRLQSYVALRVCFAAPTERSAGIRYLALQRGDLSLLNPHPPRAVWKLATVAQ